MGEEAEGLNVLIGSYETVVGCKEQCKEHSQQHRKQRIWGQMYMRLLDVIIL